MRAALEGNVSHLPAFTTATSFNTTERLTVTTLALSPASDGRTTSWLTGTGLSAFAFAMTLALQGPTFAQDAETAPAAESSTESPQGGSPLSSGSGEAVTPPGNSTDTQSGLVEVSLGDWTLKNDIADRLSVRVSAIPLTVQVPGAVASNVCPVGNDALTQQQVVTPRLTCAAKNMSDELVEAVRGQMTNPPE